MSKRKRSLLIDEHPIQVLPTLAKIIGLNEAMMLQQIHYWLSSKSDKVGKWINGIRWIYNTHEDWMKQLPYGSESTLKRTIHNLRELPLIIVTNEFNSHFKLPNKTNWYTIFYSAIEELEKFIHFHYQAGINQKIDEVKLTSWMRSKWSHAWGQIGTMESLYSTETSSETISETNSGVFDKLIFLGFSKQKAHSLVRKFGEDFVNIHIKYYEFEVFSNHKKINDPVGWIWDAINNNYTPPANYEEMSEIQLTRMRQIVNSINQN